MNVYYSDLDQLQLVLTPLSHTADSADTTVWNIIFRWCERYTSTELTKAVFFALKSVAFEWNIQK